jgi:hypothetical protein
MGVQKWRYVMDFNNLLDPIGQICYAFWSTCYITGKTLTLGGGVQWVFIPAISLTILRGVITFFKMFEKTRYLSEISVTVLYELRPFMIVLFGQNLVFAVIFKAMEFVGEDFVKGKGEPKDDYDKT